MGLFSFIFGSFRKSSKLAQISKVLGKQAMPSNALDLLTSSSQKEDAENSLFELVEVDPALVEVMKKHGADRSDLRSIYQFLTVVGGGQWVRGHWIPASALCFAFPLDYVLTAHKHGQGTPREIWLGVAARLIDYFDKGKVGPV